MPRNTQGNSARANSAYISGRSNAAASAGRRSCWTPPFKPGQSVVYTSRGRINKELVGKKCTVIECDRCETWIEYQGNKYQCDPWVLDDLVSWKYRPDAGPGEPEPEWKGGPPLE
jgi:hypothetical protein